MLCAISIRADVPDGAVPGGEPDIAFPVRSEAGDVVVGGNRTTEIDYIREFQPQLPSGFCAWEMRTS